MNLNKVIVYVDFNQFRDVIDPLVGTINKRVEKDIDRLRKKFDDDVIKDVADNLTEDKSIKDIVGSFLNKKQKTSDRLVLLGLLDKYGLKKELLFYSMFIFLFSHFEYKLNKVSKDLESKKDLNVKLKDLKGGGVYRSRKYLKKVCNLNLPNNNLWEEITIFNKVRNCLAHNGGIINSESFLNQLKDHSKFKISKEKKKVLFQSDELNYMIDNLEEYIIQLIQSNSDILLKFDPEEWTPVKGGVLID